MTSAAVRSHTRRLDGDRTTKVKAHHRVAAAGTRRPPRIVGEVRAYALQMDCAYFFDTNTYFDKGDMEVIMRLRNAFGFYPRMVQWDGHLNDFVATLPLLTEADTKVAEVLVNDLGGQIVNVPALDAWIWQGSWRTKLEFIADHVASLWGDDVT